MVRYLVLQMGGEGVIILKFERAGFLKREQYLKIQLFKALSRHRCTYCWEIRRVLFHLENTGQVRYLPVSDNVRYLRVYIMFTVQVFESTLARLGRRVFTQVSMVDMSLCLETRQNCWLGTTFAAKKACPRNTKFPRVRLPNIKLTVWVTYRMCFLRTSLCFGFSNICLKLSLIA